MHKQRLFVVIAAAVGIISAFLPWARVSMFGYSASVNGIDGGDGWLSIGLFGVAAGLAIANGDKTKVLEGTMKKAVAGVGAGAAAFMLIELLRIGFEFASFGVYLSLLAGIGVMAIPFVIKGDGGFEMPTKDSIKNELK
ncbi:MAG: hypothetical protein IPM74_06765 [Crocinitomicaceae bacterium]|nr:hypothetical protein [Crocinitomicaceae bacterium]MBK8925600.1 hypothetical protein [Crocinitomicaceae bacterium]